MDDNIGSLLEAVADAAEQCDPDRVVLVQGPRTRTWGDLDDRAARLAGHLAASGVRSGSRVGIALYNGVEYVETLFALFKLRAVPVNVNYRYRAAELREVLALVRAVGLVFDGVLSREVAQVTPQVESLTALVRVGPDTASAGIDQQVPFAKAVGAPPLPRQRRDGSDQIIVMTGGTTGRPKAVVWEHTGVRAVVSSVYPRRDLPVPDTLPEMVETARRVMVENATPVMLPLSPLIHGTGFFSTLGNLLLGGRVVFTTSRSLDAAEAWTAVQERRVDEIALVGDAFAKPLVDELELAARRARPYDLRGVRRIISAGVRWSPEVKRTLLRAGRMVLQDTIASSEGGPYGISLSGPDESTVSSMFTLAPNARVLDPDGHDIQPGSGAVGVLASTGALPLGYLDDPVATAEVFRVVDGVRYAVPGDLARVESDGELTLLGRGSSVVNTGGEKVFVEEVEEALLDHPDVVDVVVVGLPSDRWGAEVAALVCAKSGRPASTDDLSDYVGTRLAGYKRPRRVFVVDSIRRTPVGKVDRQWAISTTLRLAGPNVSVGPADAETR